MQDNEKKPALRFKGFTDPWEQRKIGDHLIPSKLPGHTGVDARKLTVKLWGKGVVEKTDSYGGSEHTQYYVRHAGQFMYGKLDFLHAAFGIVPAELDNYESTLDSPAFDLSEIDGKFLVSRVCKEDFYLKYGTIANGSRKAKRIHEDTFMDMPILVPELEEQERVAALLEALDTLITLHQRKYEKLVNIKKSMLDKMFPKNGASVPEIRFKGFTDPWEQRKLGDAFERVVRKNTNNESRLPLTISAQDGLVDQITYFNNRVASRDVSNYYLVYNGEFAYNKRTSDGYPFGAVKRLDWYEKGVLSTLYIVFALKHPEKDDSDFMTVFYDTDRWHRGVAERAAEGARNHGLLNISADDFFDIDTTMPEDKVEQEKIGRLLKKLDTLITLHQRKLEKLQNIKKSCLEKMFV